MKSDDQTFLTAFLDGELAPEPRAHVASAVSRDPRLAEDLRVLAAVRDLVAGLPRPAAPADVSAGVVARLGRRPWLRWPRPGLAVPPVTLVTAAAASALVAATLAVVGPMGGGGGGRGPRAADGPGVAAAPGRSGAAPKGATAPAPTPPRAAPGEPDAGALALAPSPDDRQRDQTAVCVRKLLDSRKLRKVLLVTDVVGDAGRRVGDLVEQTPRRFSTFGRITVGEGILIDPDHPGEAVVFALAMTDDELDRFHERLTGSFPGNVREVDARPEVLTRLAEAGPVDLLSSRTVAELRTPGASEKAAASVPRPDPGDRRETRFFRPFPSSDPFDDPNLYLDENVVTARPGGPTPEQERSGPHPSLRTGPSPSPAPDDLADGEPPARAADDPGPGARPAVSVVLVWVQSPPRRRHGAR